MFPATRASFGRVAPRSVTASERGRWHRARRGVTLIEILVVIGVVMLMAAVLAPSMASVFMLEERAAARKIASMFERLHDEAVLRNTTYRVVFYLDDHAYEIQSGPIEALVFSDPESRERFERRQRDRRDKLSEEDLAQLRQRDAFQPAEGELHGRFKLPDGSRIHSILTPQYEDPVTPTDAPHAGRRRTSRRDNEPNVASVHFFANGFAEAAVVKLNSPDAPNDGYTITVDPLSGRVSFHYELLDLRDQWRFIPNRPPSLPN